MILFAISVTILGALCASFVGVIVERVNTGASWTNDRSRCDACATTLTPRDLVPVVSWILSRGACRTCGSRIPVRHALIELLTALAFLSAFLVIGPVLSLGIFFLALLVLLFIVLYDMRHTIVPMGPVAVFILLALVFRVLSAGDSMTLGLSILVAGIAASVFLLCHVLSGGRAMGLGDAPAILGLSFLVGPANVLPGVLFSFWIGALYGVVVLMTTPKGHRMGIEVPFVPFLALGFLLAYLTGWNPLPLF